MIYVLLFKVSEEEPYMIGGVYHDVEKATEMAKIEPKFRYVEAWDTEAQKLVAQIMYDPDVNGAEISLI